MPAKWLLSAARIAIFDIAGPLVTYSVLRSAGEGAVASLVVSGAFPALGVIVGIVARRRADVIGILVLAGIALGAVLGVVSHSGQPPRRLDRGHRHQVRANLDSGRRLGSRNPRSGCWSRPCLAAEARRACLMFSTDLSTRGDPGSRHYARPMTFPAKP